MRQQRQAQGKALFKDEVLKRNGAYPRVDPRALEGHRKCSVDSNGFWITLEVVRKGWGSRERQVVGTMECRWRKPRGAKGWNSGAKVCAFICIPPAGWLGMEPARRQWRQEEGRCLGSDAIELWLAVQSHIPSLAPRGTGCGGGTAAELGRAG